MKSYVWGKRESLYLKKSLPNKLYLIRFIWRKGKTWESTSIKNINIKIDEEDQAILLLSSLPNAYEHFMDTILYGKQSLTMAEVKSALNSKE